MSLASPDPSSSQRLRRPALNIYALILLVAVLAGVGAALVLHIAAVQENRELTAWQNKLNLIADSRAADIESWLDRHFKDLGATASNPSLQMYLTDLLSTRNAPTTTSTGIAIPPEEQPAQATFLQNLLSLTADRLGFVDQPSAELKSINADVRPPSGVGPRHSRSRRQGDRGDRRPAGA